MWGCWGKLGGGAGASSWGFCVGGSALDFFLILTIIIIYSVSMWANLTIIISACRCYFNLPRQPTGGIFQDLASFAIFFDLREAHF